MVTNILAGRYHFQHDTFKNVSPLAIKFVKALLHHDYRYGTTATTTATGAATGATTTA